MLKPQVRRVQPVGAMSLTQADGDQASSAPVVSYTIPLMIHQTQTRIITWIEAVSLHHLTSRVVHPPLTITVQVTGMMFPDMAVLGVTAV